MSEPVWKIAKDIEPSPFGIGYFVTRYEDGSITSLGYTFTLWGARRVMNRDRCAYRLEHGRDYWGRPYVEVCGPLADDVR